MRPFDPLSAVPSAFDPLARRLRPLDGIEANPGNLLGWTHVPDDLAPGAPLVVVLHGCTQSAAGYDACSGWSTLAEEQGFAVLYPEQQRANNPNLCFNWFRPGDARRFRGEAASIRQMTAAMIARHGLDERRVFVTGLSAGGAMTAVMLASYPELFAAGAVIAGLPFATANSIPEALDRMRGSGMPTEAELGALASGAPRNRGSAYPRLSVWHGTADTTVSPDNADALVTQWTGLHGLDRQPSEIDRVSGHRHAVWRDGRGAVLVERYDIAGLGHGTPLQTRGQGRLGMPGPHMLEAGINSTRLIADFWGLGVDRTERVTKPVAAATPVPPCVPIRLPALAKATRPASARRPGPNHPGGIADVIDKALRSAGLLR